MNRKEKYESATILAAAISLGAFLLLKDHPFIMLTALPMVQWVSGFCFGKVHEIKRGNNERKGSEKT